VFGGDRDLDTICAVSTPQGSGGISVIRLSGSRTVEIIKNCCSFFPENSESHKAYFGQFKKVIFNKETSQFTSSDEIDDVVLTFFKEGRSFTGEQTIEISCHGNPLIAESILKTLVELGARIADRGEFSYRAFINGKMDLVQAESVLALIQAQSPHSAKMALNQLHGGLSKKLFQVEDSLTWVLAHLEASIDFSTEGIEIISYDEVTEKIIPIKKQLSEMISSFKLGRLVKDGFSVVFSGVPNVGKSSLFNLVLGEEKAIVTHIPGTTRDVLEGKTLVNGIAINFFDTAGLRESEDVVEKIGIQRSYKSQEESDLVFYVFDISKGISLSDEEALKNIPFEKVVFIANKADLVESKDLAVFWNQIKNIYNNESESDNLKSYSNFIDKKVLILSAKKSDSINFIIEKISLIIKEMKFEDLAVISNVRHYENLSKSFESINKAFSLIETNASPEYLSQDLKDALLYVQQILGQDFDDQIMDRVFKEFCIGK
jgi:tRNA modification GTPase